jgi:hypothetical protein
LKCWMLRWTRAASREIVDFLHLAALLETACHKQDDEIVMLIRKQSKLADLISGSGLIGVSCQVRQSSRGCPIRPLTCMACCTLLSCSSNSFRLRSSNPLMPCRRTASQHLQQIHQQALPASAAGRPLHLYQDARAAHLVSCLVQTREQQPF